MTGAPFHVGDTGADLEFLCANYNKRTRRTTPANLTGATLEVHCRLPTGDVLDVDGEVTDGEAGEGRHEWEPGELSVAGKWRYEVEVTFSSGKTQTFGPDFFEVEPQIA
jgi:hypothetical protein